MQAFMKESNYSAKPVKSLNEIQEVPSVSVKGSVISTAVRSDVPESYPEVLTQIRNEHPRVPVMFATLVDFETISKTIRLKLEEQGLDPNVVPISRETLRSEPLGQPNTYIVIHKDDITDPERKRLATQILNRHFG
jgi:hypothetical protein